MNDRRIVLDANILIRAVLGVRVRSNLDAYDSSIAFYSPDVCFDDARRHIPSLASRRNVDPAASLDMLERVAGIVQVVDRTLYEIFEETARMRIASRDVDDWPILATGLLLDCPIWTEDRDFFGCGVATWTTSNIQLYLRDV